MSVTINGTNGITFPSGSTQLNIGRVVQVVNATYNSTVTSSSSTYADTGLSASITPTSSSNKILVIVAQTGLEKTGSDTAVGVKLLRGSTTISQIEVFAGATGSSAANYPASAVLTYLDSPATTSLTTYKTQFNSYSNTATAVVQQGSAVSSITLMEIAQ